MSEKHLLKALDDCTSLDSSQVSSIPRTNLQFLAENLKISKMLQSREPITSLGDYKSGNPEVLPKIFQSRPELIVERVSPDTEPKPGPSNIFRVSREAQSSPLRLYRRPLPKLIPISEMNLVSDDITLRNTSPMRPGSSGSASSSMFNTSSHQVHSESQASGGVSPSVSNASRRSSTRSSGYDSIDETNTDRRPGDKPRPRRWKMGQAGIFPSHLPFTERELRDLPLPEMERRIENLSDQDKTLAKKWRHYLLNRLSARNSRLRKLEKTSKLIEEHKSRGKELQLLKEKLKAAQEEEINLGYALEYYEMHLAVDISDHDQGSNP